MDATDSANQQAPPTHAAYTAAAIAPAPEQATAPAPPPNDATASQAAGMLYDLSSLDPLQALQLTASAGLAAPLAPAPATVIGNPAVEAAQVQQLQPVAAPIHTAPEPAQQVIAPAGTAVAPIAPGPPVHTSIPAASYYYLQPPAHGVAPVQPGVSSAQQTVPIAPAGVAPTFLLPAAPPGATPTIALPPNYHFGGLPLVQAPGSQAPVVAVPNVIPYGLAPPAIQPHGATKRALDPVGSYGQPASKKMRDEAAIVPSTVGSKQSRGKDTGFGNEAPPTEQSQAAVARMTPVERRRYERNLREQQRSYRISQQIKELRDVLSESNVPFKPNKYSILLSVVEYIKQLQSRAIMLDAEHQKLITTIRKTNEMSSSANVPSSADETEVTNTTGPSYSDDENELLFVQGLDYQSLFDQCPAALGIAALDGRILECNPEFRMQLGFDREELLKHSLFNLVRNHQDIFRAMADMLKSAETASERLSTEAVANRFWSGPILSKRGNKLAMNLTLTIDPDGSPKFFNCAITTTSTADESSS